LKQFGKSLDYTFLRSKQADRQTTTRKKDPADGEEREFRIDRGPLPGAPPISALIRQKVHLGQHTTRRRSDASTPLTLVLVSL